MVGSILPVKGSSFAAAPVYIKVLLWVLIGLSVSLIGFFKVRNFLLGARKIGVDMTLYKLLEEVYTPQFVTLVLPYMISMGRLEEAGYLCITKKFKDRKPLTSVSITPRGLEALHRYIVELEGIVERLKSSAPGVEREEEK
jgi:hypothetical protein